MNSQNTETFELLLDSNFFSNGDIIASNGVGMAMEVISTPKTYYKKWYWRILNFLTFKLFFNSRYTYLCKIRY